MEGLGMLVDFCRVLRQLGLRVSTAELAEAVEALLLVPLGERELVKAALQATLVKEEEKIGVFREAFDTFFVPPEERSRVLEKHEERANQVEARLQGVEGELQFQGTPLDLTRDEKLLYGNMDEMHRQRLQEFLNKSSEGKNVTGNFKPMIEGLVRGHLQRWRRHGGGGDPSLAMVLSGDDELDPWVEEIYQSLSDLDASLLYQDLNRVAEADLPRLSRLVHTLSRRLATRVSRRYRLSGKKEQVDLRRSIRSNMGCGGIPIRLKYRRRRASKPQIVLFCDVSGSMARYSTFILQFIYGLSSAAKNIESFIFAEDLERVTPFFHRQPSFATSMSQVMERSRVWGKGTDLEKALQVLDKNYMRLVRADSIVILVSDTKTLKAEKAADALGRLRRRVREILWLNTLPQAEWASIPTVRLFSQRCRMLQCNNLMDLEQVVKNRVFTN